MTAVIDQMSRQARQALSKGDWAQVDYVSQNILTIDPNSAEGLFLSAKAKMAKRDFLGARDDFQRAIASDPKRYDAGIELAALYSSARRNSDAFTLLDRYEADLDNSPLYLDMAATGFVGIGLPQRAWPLYQKVVALQPNIDVFQGNLASCAVYAGEIDLARNTYEALLARNPGHRRNHYHLSRLGKAKSPEHVTQMKAVLTDYPAQEDRNTPLYFALGKELEDLGEWDESFQYYSKACSSIAERINYDPAADIALIDKIIELCDADWLGELPPQRSDEDGQKTPIFIAGLPRTGTTLVERIASSHSQVSSLGETLFLQMSLREGADIAPTQPITADNIDAIISQPAGKLAERYINHLSYRIGEEPYFIDKLPLNFLYLGLIAKLWPEAKIVVLNRNPMDACFSMFKQVFTFVYKFSYSLEHLGAYYVAYNRLLNHWRELLGDRLIEVTYEELVADQQGQTEQLLSNLGLDFEQACIDFTKNTGPSTTASAVQVRSKINSASVGRWRKYESHLAPLADHLRAHKINID